MEFIIFIFFQFFLYLKKPNEKGIKIINIYRVKRRVWDQNKPCFSFYIHDATNVEDFEKRIVFKENDIICYCMVHNELKN